MSAPMILQENVRCVILLISSLLAMLDTIPVLKKLLFSIGKLLLSTGPTRGTLFNEQSEQLLRILGFKREFIGVVMFEKLSLIKGTC